MTKRQQIVNAIETRFKTILVVGGYRTNLGDNVHVWRLSDWAKDEAPGVDIRDTDWDSDETGQGLHDHGLLIEVYVEAGGGTSPASVREMAADVLQAIGVDDTWGGLAIQTRPGKPTGGKSNEFQVGRGGHTYTAALMRFQVHYRTAAWQI